MTESLSAPRRFADEFSSWAIALPVPAAEHRLDGGLSARGWTVRWRWRDKDALEVRASHRMTDERWWVLRPDGTTERRHVPAAMMAYMPGDDVATIRAEYRAAQRAHGETVTAAGMDYLRPPGDAAGDDATMLWCCDGGSWQTSALAPRPPA